MSTTWTLPPAQTQNAQSQSARSQSAQSQSGESVGVCRPLVDAGRHVISQVQGTVPLDENTTPGTHDVVANWLFAQPDVRHILDVPSGSGAFAARCLAAGKRVIAGDCEPLCSLPEAEFRQLDMNQPLPLDTHSVDAAVCIDGIEHLERPFDFVQQCHRVIRPGGWLVITTPNISALRSRWRWLLTGFHNKCKTPLDETNPNPLHHVNMLDFPKLRYLLHREGFEVCRVTTNRYKAATWPYAMLAPLSYLATRWVFHGEEDDPAQRQRNAQILRQMHSLPVLFGETLIVMARNQSGLRS